ncbi:hypothetical protein MKW98_006249 [Papaver atlanticum]|uniref:Pectinesterase n=1 Tax=Papaver atlanticum TaxID=357466 RepID=A0AAD4TDP6_9MAGN|nr:hypothetical protein MKW98_006249 [Papaver atlanticum]
MIISKNSRALLIILFSLIITSKTLSSPPLGHHEFFLSEHTKAFLDSPLTSIQANIVVSQDGDGNFTTISDAIEAAPDLSNKGTIIYVKSGLYEEDYLQVGKKKINLWFIGDGINKTVISGGKSRDGDNLKTFLTASFAVKGDGFIARDLTFDNWAGPAKQQAVALLVSANRVVVHRCSITGYQDSLYAHQGTQFFRECDIYGTIDFIFGDVTAVFQNCRIYARRPLEGQFNTITAHKRDEENSTTGFSIHQSWILAAPDLDPVKNTVKTYLGRPWNLYSRVVFMSCRMEDHIDPSGWSPWEENDTRALDTLYYGEYLNDGPSSPVKKRVNWTGYHNMTSQEAEAFTVNQFIQGSTWLPSTGVPFNGGL